MKEYTILIINNDKEARAQLEKDLHNAGYLVFIAENLNETFDLLKLHNIDLLLIDTNILTNQGIEIIKQIKNKYPIIKTILLGKNFTNENIELIYETANDFVIKPYELYDLLLRIYIQVRDKEKITKKIEDLSFEKFQTDINNQILNMIIVDDDIELTQILKTNFKSKTMNVLTANSLSEAKIILENSGLKIDIAIVDILYPDSKKGGFEIINILRKEHQDCRIIIYTATQTPDFELTKAGADIVFRKPLKPSILLSNINTFIRNKMLENKLNYNLQIQMLINEFSKKIKTLDLWDLRNDINFFIKKIFSPDYYFLFILENTFSNYLAYLFCHSHKKIYDELEKNAIIINDENLISVIKSLNPIEKKNEVYPASKTLKNTIFQHYIIFPINYIRKPSGVLFLGKLNSFFSYDDIRNLETFTDILARQLEIINIHNKEKDARKLAEKLSITDELTKIYNTRYYHFVMEKIFYKANKLNQIFSLLVCDIDFFKKFNDTYGHKIGDIVLQKIAEQLSNIVRKDIDFVFRYGGEEFCIILPGVSQNELKIISEKIRSTIEKTKIETDKGILNVTISIGGTTFSNKFSSPKEMFKLADKALYISKQNGRNQSSFLFN
ncbi:MAG TPA: diguanylate cyclase [bacterium]|nr:diguanylate cyclase [bacterium]HOL48238.1 diguanylate cyclase [bacterium]HPQ18140.1 diguanylate cyclase [bacterium]